MAARRQKEESVLSHELRERTTTLRPAGSAVKPSVCASGVRQREADRSHDQRRRQERCARPAAQERHASGADRDDRESLGRERLDELAGAEERRVGVEAEEQAREGREVDQGADRRKEDHEAADQLRVTVRGAEQLLFVDVVDRDRQLGTRLSNKPSRQTSFHELFCINPELGEPCFGDWFDRRGSGHSYPEPNRDLGRDSRAAPTSLELIDHVAVGRPCLRRRVVESVDENHETGCVEIGGRSVPSELRCDRSTLGARANRQCVGPAHAFSREGAR